VFRYSTVLMVGMLSTLACGGLMAPNPSTLASVPMVKLLTPMEHVRTQYGSPSGSLPHDAVPDATMHDFEVAGSVLVRTTEWNGVVHEAVYIPENPMPDDDLRTVAEVYGEGQEWNTMSEGYMYQRADGLVRLWCSAMPPIGVGTVEFSKERRRVYDLNKADEAVRELGPVERAAE